MKFKQWEKFEEGDWTEEINVRDFIQKNYTPYEGDDSFLEGPTEKTEKLWKEVLDLYEKESKSKGAVLDIDTKTVSTVTSHAPGYIDKELEDIVGLQTDAPLKRAIMPFGGIRIVEKSCEAYDRHVDPEIDEIFHKYRKTHNDGVFSVYTPDVRAARSSHLLTGLPDGYGRGRIIGDYRRIALYGVDALISQKQGEMEELDADNFTEEIIRSREEIAEQIALATIKYADMLPVKETDYCFDLEKFCSLEGKTGPFILYSTIRMKSLLQKAKENNFSYDNLKVIVNEYDRDLIMTLNDLDIVLEKAFNEKSLNEITEYLYRIATSFNRFYTENIILKEKQEDIRSSWLYLTSIAYKINMILLDILAIKVPSVM